MLRGGETGALLSGNFTSGCRSMGPRSQPSEQASESRYLRTYETRGLGAVVLTERLYSVTPPRSPSAVRLGSEKTCSCVLTMVFVLPLRRLSGGGPVLARQGSNKSQGYGARPPHP